MNRPRGDSGSSSLRFDVGKNPLGCVKISGVVRIIYLGGLSPRLWRARLARAYTGVWGDALVGPGAKLLVRGSGDFVPLKLKTF